MLKWVGMGLAALYDIVLDGFDGQNSLAGVDLSLSTSLSLFLSIFIFSF